MRKYAYAVVSFTCTCCLLTNALIIGLAQTHAVVAVVNSETITAAQLKPFLPPGFESFEPEKALAVRKVALENAIISTILKSEARKRRVTVPLLRKQMTMGPVRVPDDQVEEEYRKNARYFGLMSPDAAKEKLRLVLETDARMKLYRSALSRLRARAKVEIKPQSNQWPALSVRGSGPFKGPDLAPVTITVFSDFECPYCREANGVLERLLKEYPDKIRLVFRHLPLKDAATGLTPATAAFCADRQGRFWAFHDTIYERSLYSPAELRRMAVDVELDIEQFDNCVMSTQPKTAIAADIAEARRLGIDGTPTFIINGRMYKGALEVDEFRKIIEGEIGSPTRGQNP